MLEMLLIYCGFCAGCYFNSSLEFNESVDKKEKIGEYFEYQQSTETKTVQSTEKKAIGLVHKLKLNKVVYFIEDMLFATKKWENKNFKNFLENFNPNIVFCFAKAS